MCVTMLLIIWLLSRCIDSIFLLGAFFILEKILSHLFGWQYVKSGLLSKSRPEVRNIQNF